MRFETAGTVYVDPDDLRRVGRLWLEGKSQAEIADSIGSTQSTVARIMAAINKGLVQASDRRRGAQTPITAQGIAALRRYGLDAPPVHAAIGKYENGAR